MTERPSAATTEKTRTQETNDGTSWITVGLGIVGVIVFAAAFTVASDLLTGVVSQLRDAVENDYLLVMVVGGVAVVLTVLLFLASRDSARTMDTPEVERPVTAPEPGARFDAQLDRWHHWVPLAGTRSRDRVRNRVRAAAIQTISTERDVSEADAKALVDDGSWTTDEVAAAFISETSNGPHPKNWLAAAARGETPIRYRARRAMTAVDEIYAGTEESR